MDTEKTDVNQISIGMVGLGSIAQKAYLPVLSQATRWTFSGVFSPDQQKMRTLCQQYRLSGFSSLEALAKECDAVMEQYRRQSLLCCQHAVALWRTRVCR